MLKDLRTKMTCKKVHNVVGFSKVEGCSEQKWKTRVASKSGKARRHKFLT